jgi:hypothetical protein
VHLHMVPMGCFCYDHHAFKGLTFVIKGCAKFDIASQTFYITFSSEIGVSI